MKAYKVVFFLVALLSWNLQFGQDEEPSLDNGSIESQFNFIAKKSGNHTGNNGIRYEVVKAFQLNKLKKNVLDSISISNNKIKELNTTIKDHSSTINSLNGKLKETTESLNGVTEEKDSMSFFGMLVSKTSYNLILWTVIASLLTLLILFIYKFRRSNVLTQEAKTGLSELETEFEDHRRRALEREQKVSRQLMDEINKNKKS